MKFEIIKTASPSLTYHDMKTGDWFISASQIELPEGFVRVKLDSGHAIIRLNDPGQSPVKLFPDLYFNIPVRRITKISFEVEGA